jgi:hypothetical protein
VVGTIGRSRKVFETAVIAAANVCFRDVMTAAENSLCYAGKVDFDVISSDIDEYNLEASGPRVDPSS